MNSRAFEQSKGGLGFDGGGKEAFFKLEKKPINCQMAMVLIEMFCRKMPRVLCLNLKSVTKWNIAWRRRKDIQFEPDMSLWHYTVLLDHSRDHMMWFNWNGKVVVTCQHEGSTRL